MSNCKHNGAINNCLALDTRVINILSYGEIAYLPAIHNIWVGDCQSEAMELLVGKSTN